MERKKPIIVIVGPTGVGKTSVSVKIAKSLNSEIINADSRQIYKYMDIGTAKPSPDLLSEVRHHLIDIVCPDEYFSAAEYQERAREIIDSLSRKGMVPVIVGGTGLYVKAVIYGLFKGPKADPDLRKSYAEYAEKFGKEALYNRLKEVDEGATKRIHPMDTVRVMRALEVYDKTGKTISSLQDNFTLDRSPYIPIIIGLYRERKDLYRKIEERADSMIQEGLVHEVESLLKRGYSEELRSMMGIGYGQVISFLRGEYDLEKAISLVKRDTKRYAKRQMTWFNKVENINWVEMTDHIENDLTITFNIIETNLKMIQKEELTRLL